MGRPLGSPSSLCVFNCSQVTSGTDNVVGSAVVRAYGFYILDCFLGFVPRSGITRARYTLSNCFPKGLYPHTVPMPESSIILNKKSLFNAMIKKFSYLD